MHCGVERYHLRGEGSPPEVFCASSVAQWVHVDEPAVALLLVLAQCANFPSAGQRVPQVSHLHSELRTGAYWGDYRLRAIQMVVRCPF